MIRKKIFHHRNTSDPLFLSPVSLKEIHLQTLSKSTLRRAILFASSRTLSRGIMHKLFLKSTQKTLGCENHWFMRREHTKLWISKTFPLQSESPPVLKTYAYIARLASGNPRSLHRLRISVPAHGNNSSRILRSHLNPSHSSTL
jgi:hypothetical protein